MTKAERENSYSMIFPINAMTYVCVQKFKCYRVLVFGHYLFDPASLLKMSMSRYCDIFSRQLIGLEVTCQDSEFEGLQFGRFGDNLFFSMFLRLKAFPR